MKAEIDKAENSFVIRIYPENDEEKQQFENDKGFFGKILWSGYDLIVLDSLGPSPDLTYDGVLFAVGFKDMGC